MQSGPADYLWLATEGAGLVRFDGYEFLSLANEEMPVVKGLARANQGLWLFSASKLAFYNGLIFTFYKVPANSRISKVVADSLPWLLAEDGEIWRQQKDTILAWPTPDSSAVRDLIVINNQLYALSEKGIYSWQTNGWQRKVMGSFSALNKNAGRLSAQKENFYFPDILNQKDSTLLGSKSIFSNGYGQLIFNSQTLAWQQKNGDTLQITSPKDLEGSLISEALLTEEGNLILATNKGLSLLESPDYYSLADSLGQVLNLTRFQDFVVVGNAEGAHFYKNNKRAFSLSKIGLVLALSTWNSALYLGTESGLWRYKNGKLKLIEAVGREFVFSLLSQPQSLLIGTGAEILELSPQGEIQSISNTQQLPFATVFKMQAAPDGSLWCATYTQGFFRKTSAKGWQHLNRWGGLALDSLRFSTFLALNQDSVWIGTQNNGLYKLGPEQNTHYTFSDLRFSELRAMSFGANCTSAKAPQIWLGTNKGLLLLSEVQKAKKRGKNQLPFIGGSISGNALFYKSGVLYSGLSKGYQQIALCNYLQSKQQLPQRIAGFNLLKGEKVNLDNREQNREPYTLLPQQLELPHNSNYLNFSYSAAAFLRPQEVFYRYRLKGQNQGYTYSLTKGEALFADLDPGRYTFEMQARRLGNPWPQKSASYSFLINRPFYQTWWFITALILVVGSLAFFIARDRLKRLKQRLRLEGDLLEMERKALRLQMNPHFIFNALDSISSFIFKKDQKQAVRYLNNFAKLMRLTLESSMEHVHPVETEVSILKNYLELEKLRFGGKFDYHIEVDEELDFDVGLPPMLVQPHVENAILHGLKPMVEGGKLDISFTLEEAWLCVKVEDNGVGRAKAKENPQKAGHRSMATKINIDRLKLLQSALGETIELKIEDKYADNGAALGTKVTIRLPVQDI